MCSPGAPSQYPSGWHLHLSLVQAAGGVNLFTPAQCDRLLSPVGRAFVGGLLAQAAPSDTPQQSNRPSGAATIGAFRTVSISMAFCRCAFGFFAPFS